MLNRGGKLPDYLVKTSNHYANLFEAPVLFYCLCVIIYSSHQTDGVYLVLAWLFALSRYAHAYIHITYNDLKHRRNAFLAGMVVLGIMWGRFAVQLLVS